MILDEARIVLETGSLCDACLGRPFAALSHGLRNDQRGRALRIALALDDNEPFDTPDDCWVCEGLTDRFDSLADRGCAAVADVEFDTYLVGTRLPPLLEENDSLLRKTAGREGETLSSECNREIGRRIGASTGTEVAFDRPDIQLVFDIDADDLEVQLNPAFVYGRYRKLERGIPQTEWPCRDCDRSGRQGTRPCPTCDGTGYLYQTSVEQLVAPPISRAFHGTEAVFHGAGREDVDARMLGTGRPFVVEVKQPHRRHIDVEILESEINEATAGRVEVDDLRLASHEMVERVKELEASKTYRLQVSFGSTVEESALADAMQHLRGTEIEQRTPSRVAHRRADRVRRRRVYDASGTLEGPRTAEIEIHGEGGLYVKELVSGDDGRTSPSLAGLLDVSATVESLDVVSVQGETEPFERSDYFLAA